MIYDVLKLSQLLSELCEDGDLIYFTPDECSSILDGQLNGKCLYLELIDWGYASMTLHGN